MAEIIVDFHALGEKPSGVEVAGQGFFRKAARMADRAEKMPNRAAVGGVVEDVAAQGFGTVGVARTTGEFGVREKFIEGRHQPIMAVERRHGNRETVVIPNLFELEAKPNWPQGW